MQLVLMVLLVAFAAPIVWKALGDAWAGRFATGLVAALAIVGAIALRQPIAGLVVVLMKTGGEWLERYAEGKASTAVRALEEAAPRRAHRLERDHVLDIDASVIAVGDRLLVRP